VVRAALLATCLVDGLFPQVGKATVQVLERLGVEVYFPQGQTCCGQMHINSGYASDALPLIEHHVATFADAEAVVAPSGSCTGAIRHQHALLARSHGREDLARSAEAIAARTYELSEFIVDHLGITDAGGYFPHRVTYHPTCHSLRLLEVGDRPLTLLRAVKGIELVELTDADSCCGFGGTFALKNPDVSAAMLADKLTAVRSTKAEIVTASDSSCLMHIGGGLSRFRLGIRPVHLAEILAGEESA
jgi:L-lactate dehydrogenase complex protein LldE